jgi:hypothetical protein
MATGPNFNDFRADQPMTMAVREVMRSANNPAMLADLLFLERWEAMPSPGMGSVLRAAQIRRANPDLAAKVRREVSQLR